MPWVIFLRGVNVGGHNRFQPSLLIKQLAPLRAVNIGAAGTMVVFGKISPSRLRSKVLEQLAFKPEVIVCDAREILKLAEARPFEGEKLDRDHRAFLTVMAKIPGRLPPLPIYVPATDNWQVKVIAVSGNSVLSLWHRVGQRLLYPNEAVERAFGALATTRSWNTIEKIVKIAGSDPP
jgi:uncharacterized protein (DUF1697 family)